MNLNVVLWALFHIIMFYTCFRFYRRLNFNIFTFVSFDQEKEKIMYKYIANSY